MVSIFVIIVGEHTSRSRSFGFGCSNIKCTQSCCCPRSIVLTNQP